MRVLIFKSGIFNFAIPAESVERVVDLREESDSISQDMLLPLVPEYLRKGPYGIVFTKERVTCAFLSHHIEGVVDVPGVYSLPAKVLSEHNSELLEGAVVYNEKVYFLVKV